MHAGVHYHQKLDGPARADPSHVPWHQRMPDVVGPLNLLVLLLAHDVQAAAHTPEQQAFRTTVASANPHVAPLDVRFSAPVVVDVLVVSYDLLRVGCPVGKPEHWCQAQGFGYDGGRDFVFAMKVHVTRTKDDSMYGDQ